MQSRTIVWVAVAIAMVVALVGGAIALDTTYTSRPQPGIEQLHTPMPLPAEPAPQRSPTLQSSIEPTSDCAQTESLAQPADEEAGMCKPSE